MIARSMAAKVVSLVTAGTLVIGGFFLTASDLEVEIEGGAEGAAMDIGTAFEDMVTGTLSAEPVETPVVEAMEPEVTEPQAVAAPMEAVEPVEAPAPEVTQAAPTQAAEALPVEPAQAALVPLPMQPLAPSEVPVVSAQAPAETIEAQEPESAAPPASQRPQRRDPAKAPKQVVPAPAKKTPVKKEPVKKTPVKKAPPKQAAKAPSGNAQRNNTKGAATTSSKTTKGTQSGTAKRQSAQSGNAAASNYPGQVMRRISRVSKPRVKSRGTAVIAFSVSGNGGLARVSVARSSGSAALDQAAVAVIRKAAPFPAPPKGAQRQFTIRIKGR
ncbi:TonB family protein [Alphaproteobacteria bacterium KMM 3653]|uniref:TonB family protein n=1 Tax=Harenicola maris TaxID=2841044 RepID=A0AAP2CRY7_9RHOB|nr:TonB family protein [Harenicola maris]